METVDKSISLNWSLVNFCELDKYAIKSYCAIHNTDESLNLGDITKVDEKAIEDFNTICGGSPCQDFSIAGKREGAVWTCLECGHEYNPLTVHWDSRDKCPSCMSTNVEKTRSSLLVEYLRIVREKMPRFGIYENVKNIVGKQFEDTFKMFTSELEEYGYNVYWDVLNSKNYGVPQNRERVYLLFVKKDLDNGEFKFPKPFDNSIRLKDLLDSEVEEKFYISNAKTEEFLSSIATKDVDWEGRKIITGFARDKGGSFVREADFAGTLLARDYKGFGNQEMTCVIENNAVGNSLKQVAQIYPNSGNPQAGRVYDPEGISPAMDTCQGGNRMPKIFDKKELRIRRLTPKECFRLMGFCDEQFDIAKRAGISDSQLYKQAGNSIVVDVLYYIYRELYEAMPYLFEGLKLGSFFSGIGAFEAALDKLYNNISAPTKRRIKVLELFSGAECISNAFRNRGHECFTIDWDRQFPSSWHADISKITAQDILERFGKPDVIWVGTDCTSYSVAAISRHRKKNKKTGNLDPVSDYAKFCDNMNVHVKELIKELNPKIQFWENPRAGLRKMSFMRDIPRYTVTYCQYMMDEPWEKRRMKPTDIWTDHPNPKFKPPCRNGSSCHPPAPRGTNQYGTQALKGTVERSMYPKELCEHIVDISEEYIESLRE